MQDTRWGSVYSMLNRFVVIRPHVTAANGFGDGVLALVPSALEDGTLKVLLEILSQVHKVSMILQREDQLVSLAHARSFFDKLIIKIPSFAEYLGPDANIIHMPIFEKAVIKVQKGNETSLTKDEKTALLPFRKNVSDIGTSQEETKNNDDINEFEASYNEINELKKRKIDDFVSKYISLDNIEPTSNAAERLFSRAKLYSSDRRKRTTPYHFELLLMLWYNKAYWDETTVDAAINMVDPAIVVQADENEDEA